MIASVEITIIPNLACRIDQLKGSGHNQSFAAFPIIFCCFSPDSPELLHVSLIPLGNVAPMFYPRCFVLHFAIKMKILPMIIAFLLHTKCKAVDKTLEQCFLKERPHAQTLVNLS